MSHRVPQHVPPFVTNSLMIRQEIQRFESVHPCIYALYDLIEEGLPADSPLQRQLHDYIVCIEGITWFKVLYLHEKMTYDLYVYIYVL